tara:strand:+ start:365 stop:661 length:297 start_codon:yes stop_codon:yes gene_type:complete
MRQNLHDKQILLNKIYHRGQMSEYFKEPRCKGKKIELSRFYHDDEFHKYHVKVSFTGVDKCLDSWDDIHRSDSSSGWGNCRSWKDATKRKHQWFKHVI